MTALLKSRFVSGLLKTVFMLALPASTATAQVTSALWGVDGNAWDPTNSILRDFTRVG